MELSLFIQQAPVAAILLTVTVVISLMAFRRPDLKAQLMLHPWSVKRNKTWWQMLSSGFVHADFMHLAMNMLSFYMFAWMMEREMAYSAAVKDGDFGVMAAHWKFFLVYVVCQLVSDAVAVIRYRDRYEYASLGASGAVSGIILFTVMVIEPRLMVWGIIPGWLFALLYMAYSWYASRNVEDKIGHDAHFWGAAAGLALGWILYPERCVRNVTAIIDSFF